MAEYVGTGPWYPTVGVAGLGGTNKAVKNAAGATDSTSSATSTNGTSAWYIVKPAQALSAAATGGTSTGGPSSSGVDSGFDFLSADFDATAAAPGGLPASRVVSGTVTTNFTVSYSSALGTGISWATVFFKRSAAGAFTFLATALSSSAASTATSITASASIPATVFAAGDTLYAEVWVKMSDVVAGVTHLTATYITGSANTWSGPQLAYNYPRSTSDNAPASDTLTRSVIRVRNVTDSAPAADTASRGASIFTRSATESAPASDSLARQVTLRRATNEYLGGTPDYPVTTPASIAGVVTYNGAPRAGATCRLLRDSDEYLAATVTTGADGRYTFTRDAADPNTYHVEVYVGTTLHGLTDRGLTPS